MSVVDMLCRTDCWNSPPSRLTFTATYLYVRFSILTNHWNQAFLMNLQLTAACITLWSSICQNSVIIQPLKLVLFGLLSAR